ncbi:protein kinase domain containing protein [Aphelenchoides avenae]|nr:protein kinase domain containing protein [Aphelenchus avenae]
MGPLENAGFNNHGKKLGKGSFGVTYEGWQQVNDVVVGQDKITVAIKVVPKEKFRDYRRDSEGEVLRLKALSDAENIVTMLGYINDPSHEVKNVYIVLDYCNQGSGMEIIHRNNIIHRDLKPDNILLHAEGSETEINGWTVKIADFGLSKILKDGQMKTSTEHMGSQHYAAPEVLSVPPEGYGQPADLWSMGVVLYECYMKTLPYGNRTAEDLVELYENSNPTPKFSLRWHSSSRTLEDLIKRLLQIDAEKRPTIGQIMQEPFISETAAAVQPNLPTNNGS